MISEHPARVASITIRKGIEASIIYRLFPTETNASPKTVTSTSVLDSIPASLTRHNVTTGLKEVADLRTTQCATYARALF